MANFFLWAAPEVEAEAGVEELLRGGAFVDFFEAWMSDASMSASVLRFSFASSTIWR
jgi:hypothetical protein